MPPQDTIDACAIIKFELIKWSESKLVRGKRGNKAFVLCSANGINNHIQLKFQILLTLN